MDPADEFATSQAVLDAIADVVRSAQRAEAGELLDFAARCWQAPERELQYVATDALRAGRARIDSENIWIARSALLRQLHYEECTDATRLFGSSLRRAADTEFFIRKAIGWALRQYSKVAPAAVVAFVDEHEHTLSGLTAGYDAGRGVRARRPLGTCARRAVPE